MLPLKHERFYPLQVVNLLRSEVVNFNRPKVVNLNRSEVVNFIGFSNIFSNCSLTIYFQRTITTRTRQQTEFIIKLVVGLLDARVAAKRYV